MLSDTQLFLFGPDPSNKSHMYKARFSSAKVEWWNIITCNNCKTLSDSESLLSEDNSKIYSVFEYLGYNWYDYRLYFMTMSSSTGSVESKIYKSNYITESSTKIFKTTKISLLILNYL